LIHVYLLMALCSVMGQSATDAGPDQFFTFERPQMGVPFRLQLSTDQGASHAQSMADQVWKRIEQLNHIFSNYQTDSELSQLGYASGQGNWTRVSPDLWSLIVRSQEFSRRSEGAFDLTAGPLTALWRKCRREGVLPPSKALSQAMSKTGWGGLLSMPEKQSVCLTQPGMRLDPGGIAKGYALDAGIEVLKINGIKHALLSGGGDMRALGGRTTTQAWQIRLAEFDEDSAQEVALYPLKDAAVATSGDLFQFVEIDGKRYSHILDPRTGMGLTLRMLVTVVAPDATTADATATTLSVMGPELGRLWLEEQASDCQVRLLWIDEGGDLARWQSSAF
jgi:thiamine biosynthesis lipoprotein